jgi:signal transduction histidine kinase
VLLACSVLLLAFYAARRNISPVPLLAFPLYDAATAGYLAWSIAIPAGYMAIGLGLAVGTTRQGIAAIASEFLPSIALLAVAVALGDSVRSRRALAAETAEKLKIAEEESIAEAGRAVAEERLRIARELHDTVAHAMATKTHLSRATPLGVPRGE